jgi:hypothetical protein
MATVASMRILHPIHTDRANMSTFMILLLQSPHSYKANAPTMFVLLLMQVRAKLAQVAKVGSVIQVYA